MKNKKGWKLSLRSIRLGLLYALPSVLFFSYHPVMMLGSSDSMNLELSLPLIWLVVFDFLSFISIFLLAKSRGFKRSLQGLSDAKFFIFSLLPLYITLSSLWSPNPLRAVLTSALSWALFIAIFSIYELLRVECCKNYNTFWQKFKKSLYISTAAVCVFCWIQCILDLVGAPRRCSLLCLGCTSSSFGFPHPNGFAIEPQFMGSLLLAPCIMLLIDILKQSSGRLYLKLPLSIFFITTLFIVFSRGAIYSFVLAFVVIVIYFVVKSKSPKPLLSIPLVLLSFLLGLTAQGLMAELSPTSDTFTTAVAKSLHQVSLGRIDLRPTVNEPVENPVENSHSDSRFDGYVTESTEIRVMLTEYALNLWHQSPENVIFGIGIGGAGMALSEAYPDIFTPKEIIQNEYASLALETGFTGLALLALSCFLIMKKLHNIKRPRSPNKILFFALAIAYAASLFFFSGLPNALHTYLFLALTLINAII